MTKQANCQILDRKIFQSIYLAKKRSGFSTWTYLGRWVEKKENCLECKIFEPLRKKSFAISQAFLAKFFKVLFHRRLFIIQMLSKNTI